MTPRLAALGGRREHVMRLLAQMHAAPDQGSLQAELVASLREEMRALQRERLALLQLAALRPNLSRARAGRRAAAGTKTRLPSTLPQARTAHCTAPHSTAQHRTAPQTALHRTAPHSTAQHRTASHSVAQHRPARTLRCTALPPPTAHARKAPVDLGAALLGGLVAGLGNQAGPGCRARSHLAAPHSYGCRLRSSSSTV